MEKPVVAVPVLASAEELDLPVLCHSDTEDLREDLERGPHLKLLAAHMTNEYEEKARLTWQVLA